MDDPKPHAHLAKDLIDASARFRQWATSVPEHVRHGEWECDYPSWGEIYAVFDALLSVSRAQEWPEALVDTALYLIARDNECQYLAHKLPRESLCFLAEKSVSCAEPDAKWQLAIELGGTGEIEHEALLLRLADDDHEYVRRRSLQGLAKIESRLATRLALREWDCASGDSPWTRMNVLWVLHRVGAPELRAYVAKALASPDELLRGYAERVGRGEVEPNG